MWEEVWVVIQVMGWSARTRDGAHVREGVGEEVGVHGERLYDEVPTATPVFLPPPSNDPSPSPTY